MLQQRILCYPPANHNFKVDLSMKKLVSAHMPLAFNFAIHGTVTSAVELVAHVHVIKTMVHEHYVIIYYSHSVKDYASLWPVQIHNQKLQS